MSERSRSKKCIVINTKDIQTITLVSLELVSVTKLDLQMYKEHQKINLESSHGMSLNYNSKIDKFKEVIENFATKKKRIKRNKSARMQRF